MSRLSRWRWVAVTLPLSVAGSGVARQGMSGPPHHKSAAAWDPIGRVRLPTARIEIAAHRSGLATPIVVDADAVR